MNFQKFPQVMAALVLFCGVLCFSGGPLLAQTGTSSVSGTVTDAQGKAVAGASVTLSNPDKNFTRTATTTESGTFSFSSVPPDSYNLEATATGFKRAVVTEVHALIAKPTEINVTLEVGAVAESVTVSSSSAEALLNTQDASLGNNFESRQITQLPLEARDVTALLTLQPGVTREGYVAGARNDQANVTLDGVDINEAQTNRPGGPTGIGGSNTLPDQDNEPDANTTLRLNAEAIAEFRVTTTNPNASLGRTSGAQISLVTKGGSNDFHGSLFEYHRNTIFTANDFFNNRNGRFTAEDSNVILGQNKVGDLRNPRPKLLRNVFGGTLGGPILKDRAFFFYSYEGRRDAKESVVVETVPLPSLGRGEVRYVNPSGSITTLTASNLATIFPALNGTNPAALQALAAAAAKYPANDFTVGDSTPDALLNTAGFRFNAPTPVRLNSHQARFDYNLTSKQQLLARISVQHDLYGGAPAFPDTPTEDTWSHPWGLVAGHTWTISNSLVNSFRYGLTREGFTRQGDSAENAVYFRFVFSPRNYDRTISRVTPVHNFIDDLSWVKGNHTTQFGTSIWLINNRRNNYANAYDTAITNPSFYAQSATPISTAINAFSPIGSGNASLVQNATSAVLGRFTQYSARFTFDREGNLLPSGTPTKREFATQEYDVYAQDVWKIRPSLTLTYGLRYGLSRPVYETQGFEVKPNIPLSEFFRRRLEGMKQGIPYNDPISIDLSGPANGRSPLYTWDKNNFQPRIAVAWSPNFKSGFLGKFFGRESQSVVRGGFAITNDYYGQQLAVTFDNVNTLGFVSNTTISAGTYNITDRLGPLYTGSSLDIRSLPGIDVPGKLTFPQSTPSDGQLRIETSLDEAIKAPIHYSWNVTFERTLPHGLLLQTSYIGRKARHLLAERDVMTPNNLVDPKSGMDWYTAAGQLEILRAAGTPISSVAPIPYFENLFGGVSGFARSLLGSRRASLAANATQAVYGDAFIFNGNDWSTTQADIDGALPSNIFYQPQYGALSTFSSIGNSDYHAGTLSVRERLGQSLTLDFNYTLSHSMDDASGLQSAGTYGTAFILNPIRQRDNYADSDFDVRHVINFNSVWQLPLGRGRRFLSSSNKVLDAFIGGWQLSAIYRWNSGLPIYSPFDDARWATNWEVQSSAVRIKPIKTCPTKGGTEAPKLFCDPSAAYHSWRNARPGETGDRNVLRLPGYIDLDAGLSKSFGMPWSEKHHLEIHADAFNVTNTQRMGNIDGSRIGFGIALDPGQEEPPTTWSNFTKIQGTPRVIQFGIRYEF